MIRNQIGSQIAYHTKDCEVQILAIQILNFLGIEFQQAVGADGYALLIHESEGPRFEREIGQWQRAATKLTISQ